MVRTRSATVESHDSEATDSTWAPTESETASVTAPDTREYEPGDLEECLPENETCRDDVLLTVIPPLVDQISRYRDVFKNTVGSFALDPDAAIKRIFETVDFEGSEDEFRYKVLLLTVITRFGLVRKTRMIHNALGAIEYELESILDGDSDTLVKWMASREDFVYDDDEFTPEECKICMDNTANVSYEACECRKSHICEQCHIKFILTNSKGAYGTFTCQFCRTPELRAEDVTFYDFVPVSQKTRTRKHDFLLTRKHEQQVEIAEPPEPAPKRARRSGRGSRSSRAS